MNPTLGEITIHKGTRVGRVERVGEEAVATLMSQDGAETTTSPYHPDAADSQVSSEKKQMLRNVVEGMGKNLNLTEKEQFYGLFLEYSDVFASSDANLGRTSRLKHPIDTTGFPPIRQPVQRVPPTQREEIHQLL